MASKSFDEGVKPAEDRVILLNIANAVPLDARIDGHRDHQAEGRRVECVDGRGRGDVGVNDKLGDVVCNWTPTRLTCSPRRDRICTPCSVCGRQRFGLRPRIL